MVKVGHHNHHKCSRSNEMNNKYTTHSMTKILGNSQGNATSEIMITSNRTQEMHVLNNVMFGD